jgi:alcohol dehydrogenase
MSSKTRSAVLESFGKVSVREFPLPEIGDEDGLLRVEMVGVCGSDVGMYTGKTRRIEPYLPIIQGHEILGHIAEAGETFCLRHGLDIGDRVLVEFTFGCGYCKPCLTGEYRLCKKMGRYGSYISCNTPPHLWGGYGEHLYLPPRAMVHKIDPSVPPEAAVIVSAVLGNGIRWLRQMGGVSIGDTVVIEGPGPQGLAGVVAARESGAARIIVTGLSGDKGRFEMARLFGAHHVVDVSAEDPVAVVGGLTGGGMADVVMDVTGNPQGALSALDLVRQGGTIVLPGTYGTDTPVPLPLDKVVLKEIRIQGVYSHDLRSVIPAIKLAEGRKYPLERMVTHCFPLQEVERAIRLVGGLVPGETTVKAVVNPNLDP